MKQMRSWVYGFLACGLVAGMISTASAQNVVEGRAKVIRIKGDARYSTGNNVWQQLHVGDVLKPGSLIQTSKDNNSYVDLVLGDGNAPVPASLASGTPTVTRVSYQPSAEQNIVRIFENTVLGVDKLSTMETGADTVSETQLDLKQGHIFGSVKKMSAASKYEVKIPNGVAGIRGTVYDIRSTGLVRVASGSVVIAYVGADGTVVTQVIMGGQQFDARTGQVTPIPPDQLHWLETIEHHAHFVQTTPPTTFTVDHTIHVALSPVTGSEEIIIEK